ncbi:MAG TPA: LptF/LptG family permease [Fimbriimonas sp.]|nr:LptF/LptG family permease [Fimbriimonas sp.]
MKKIDQYVIREMFWPFLIGTVAVVLMFQANTYIGVAKRLNMDNVPFKAVLQFILYSTPQYLNYTLPVGAALGSALAMARLTRESELTAMRAAGARILRVIAPITAVGFFISLAHFYMLEVIMPPATKEANRLGMQIGFLGYAPNVKTNTILQLGRVTASFGTVDRNGEDMDIEKVLLVEQVDSEKTQLITADRAAYHNGQWIFKNAYLRVLSGEDFWTVKPEEEEFVVNERIIPGDIFNSPSAEEPSARKLWQSIVAAKKAGNDTKSLEVKLHAKLALPVACLIFTFVAPIFAIVFGRSGGFAGVFLSLGLCIAYYNVFIVSTEILYKLPWIPGWLAPWLANIVFTLVGLIVIRRLE